MTLQNSFASVLFLRSVCNRWIKCSCSQIAVILSMNNETHLNKKHRHYSGYPLPVSHLQDMPRPASYYPLLPLPLSLSIRRVHHQMGPACHRGGCNEELLPESITELLTHPPRPRDREGDGMGTGIGRGRGWQHNAFTLSTLYNVNCR